MASAFFFPVDIGMLRPPISPEGETEEPAVPAPESDRTEEPGSDMEEAVPEESSPVPENEEPRPVDFLIPTNRDSIFRI